MARLDSKLRVDRVYEGRREDRHEQPSPERKEECRGSRENDGEAQPDRHELLAVLSAQPVTHTAYRLDIVAIKGDIHLVAQVLHVLVHDVRSALVGKVPHGVDDL